MPHRMQFRLGEACRSAPGEFEILAITAGEGNGWRFSADVLRQSLAQWDGVNCFVDHADTGRSLRDLAGVCRRPTWDIARQGIRLTLQACGPAGGLLARVGREWLDDPAPDAPRIGFSADLAFTAEGRSVTRILKVYSVDLVLDPARGGAFVRALQTETDEPDDSKDQGGTQPMTESTQSAAPTAAESTDMHACLLETALAASRLPAPAGEFVRRRFSGRNFTPAELNGALEDARRLVSDLTGPERVQGPAVGAMFSAEDQISAAMFDLLGADRPTELRALKTARLSGIRELYTRMTGDSDFRGGCDPARAQFATTASLPNVLANALNKMVVQQWQELGRAGYRWWESVVHVEHFNSLQSISGVLVGEITALPAVAEGAAYTELAINDSAETAEWSKYGGYIGLTLEMFERDETHRLRQYPNKLASAALRRISALVASVFTANAGAGPLMADTHNVFDAVNHANLGTSALSSSTWEAAGQAIYNQPMQVGAGGTAPRLALDAKYLLVPRGLRLTGMQILYPNLEHTANILSENMQRGQPGDVITVPEFTDANDWAAVADPRLAPGIVIGERFGLLPEIILADAPNSGALFTNDELRMKVRHWLAVMVADYRPLYKANVAA